ncbi:MFS transporter [Novosphingobium profundi]|uniref:MFS transporter n=1 Tax=Novosphingobium profundi TaxID=1774954 RepID=UPI001BDB2ABD|nr:MFS transporter [Novosphingobium profundi]MBT0670476.1 MFS transporter [Novosphingobium profundi]
MQKEFTSRSAFVVLGVWLAFLTGPNAMVAATNSNFLNVLPGVLGASRTAVSGALAVSVWLVALVIPFTGRLMDRFGVRAVILPALVGFAAIYFLMGTMTQLWHFYVLQILLAFVITACNAVGYAKVVSTWFDRNRGLVLGLCVAFGAGLGQTIMPQVSQWAIGWGGYRGGYWLIAAIILCIGFPAVFLLVRTPDARANSSTTPHFEPGEPDTNASPAAVPFEDDTPQDRQTIGLTFREAIRTRELYLIFTAIAFASMSLLGTIQQAVPMLTDRGVDVSAATTVMSFVFMGVVAGEFSAGLIVDRLNTPKVVLPYFLCAIVGLYVLHHVNNTTALTLGAPLMGLGLGCEVGLNAYLISRYFGLKSFGTLYGLTMGASNLGIGLGIVLMGFVRDTWGSYAPMGTVFLGTMSISLICILVLGPFRYAPARR